MPRRLAVEMKCDRCGAVWSEDYTPGSDLPETSNMEVTLALMVDGVPATRTVKFEVLCEKCAPVCSNYLDSIERKKKDEETDEKGPGFALRDPEKAPEPRAVAKEEGGTSPRAPSVPPKQRASSASGPSAASSRASVGHVRSK